MPFLRGLLAARRELREATRGSDHGRDVERLFNEMLCRSAADLSMLMTDTPQGRYPYAGIPWFSTTFGRDGLITALQMLWWSPDVARGVLRRLAAYQAKTTDPLADAEPGKILHEMRGGEMAALREVPFGLYYGSVDSTPLFVLLAGLYAERTGDVETIAELWPAIEAALGWIDGPGDPDGDGFVEYDRATEQGLANQGWKDSHDAIFHADGRLAEGPIALAEVQGYVYAAKRMAARCARRLGRDEQARKLDAEASRLADAFRERPSGARTSAPMRWRSTATRSPAACAPPMPARCCSPASPRPIAPRASRKAAAAALLLRLGHPHRREGRGALQPDVVSQRLGLAARQCADRAGLARYGHKRRSRRCSRACSAPPPTWTCRRLPELFCGFQRQHGHGPTLYPVACSPQAWASATPFTLLEASLGLEFDPCRGDPSAQSAPAAVSRRSDAAQPAARRIERRSAGPPPQRHGVARYAADQRRYPGFGRVFLVIAAAMACDQAAAGAWNPHAPLRLSGVAFRSTSSEAACAENHRAGDRRQPHFWR